jgi:GT2 family glycosyltransferase
MSNRGLPQDAGFHPLGSASDSEDDVVLTGAARRRPRSARRAAWRRQFLEEGTALVSVCIANWNCRQLLRGCLESLQDQPQGLRLEVIVVDNGSTDGAADMVAREFPEVVLVRNATNRGFSRASNQAAAKARGRYLLFLNNDTVVPPGTLRRLVEFAERHPEVGMVGPRLRNAQGQVQVSYRQQPTMAALLHKTTLLRWTALCKRAYQRYRRQDFDPDTVRNVDVLMGAALLITRTRFQLVGGWDETFIFGGEDLELSMRVNQSAAVTYCPQAEIVHFGRASSRLHIGFASAHMAIGLVRYLRKSGYWRGALVGYKMAITVDAPVQVIIKTLQGAWRRLLRDKPAAHKSWLAAQGVWHFLRHGLIEFWQA